MPHGRPRRWLLQSCQFDLKLPSFLPRPPRLLLRDTAIAPSRNAQGGAAYRQLKMGNVQQQHHHHRDQGQAGFRWSPILPASPLCSSFSSASSKPSRFEQRHITLQEGCDLEEEEISHPWSRHLYLVSQAPRTRGLDLSRITLLPSLLHLQKHLNSIPEVESPADKSSLKPSSQETLKSTFRSTNSKSTSKLDLEARPRSSVLGLYLESRP